MSKSAHLIVVFIFAILLGCNNTESEKTPQEGRTETPTISEKVDQKKVIIFFGNSLSAGYGVEADESFPAVIQARIDSLNLPYTVVNAGVSGETSATGLSRIDWVLDKQKVDVFVLELGANDGLRGLPPAETKKNLIAIIDRVRKAYPEAEIILAGMMVPPSMGEEYSSRYNPIYGEIQKETNVALIPFLLENVGGIDSLNQSDGIHPNAAGARILAENTWEILGPIITK